MLVENSNILSLYKLKETVSISNKLGSRRKVNAFLKYDNLLSAREIQLKLEEQGIKVNNILVTIALKSRKYNYQKTNVETMLLNDIQKKSRKELYQNYIDLD